jgi:hypothetical protein
MIMADAAWNAVTPETIQHCWNHTKIQPWVSSLCQWKITVLIRPTLQALWRVTFLQRFPSELPRPRDMSRISSLIDWLFLFATAS